MDQTGLRIKRASPQAGGETGAISVYVVQWLRHHPPPTSPTHPLPLLVSVIISQNRAQKVRKCHRFALLSHDFPLEDVCPIVTLKPRSASGPKWPSGSLSLVCVLGEHFNITYVCFSFYLACVLFFWWKVIDSYRIKGGGVRGGTLSLSRAEKRTINTLVYILPI